MDAHDATDLGVHLATKRMRTRELLEEMNRAAPSAEKIAVVAPHTPDGKRGLLPLAMETMLRSHDA